LVEAGAEEVVVIGLGRLFWSHRNPRGQDLEEITKGAENGIPNRSEIATDSPRFSRFPAISNLLSH